MKNERVPRPYCDIRKKFADGYAVEYREPGGDRWIEQENPSFYERYEWRVKPEIEQIGEWKDIIDAPKNIPISVWVPLQRSRQGGYIKRNIILRGKKFLGLEVHEHPKYFFDTS